MNKRIYPHLVLILLAVVLLGLSGLLTVYGLQHPTRFLPQTRDATAYLEAMPTPSSPPFVAFPRSVLTGTAHYVSTIGDDNSPGTYEQPWRTFLKACQMLGPGETLYIRGGIYHEQLIVDQSGTEEHPIQILAYPGETPVIDGENQLPVRYGGLIEVSGDWVQLSGIEVRYSQYQGIQLVGRHDLADNLFVHHSQRSGGFIFGDYSIFQNSRVWRNSLINEFGKSKAVGVDWASGISSARDFTDGVTHYAIIRNNEVWENWGEGISTFESDHSIIENNKSHDNWAVNIYLSDTTNSLCQGNFVYMDPSSYVYGGVGGGANVGILMGDERYAPPSANIVIKNNIAYGNIKNFTWWHGLQGGGMNNVLIAHNTFVNSTGVNLEIGDGLHLNVRFVNNIVQQDGFDVAYAYDNPGVYYSNNLWSRQPDQYVVGPGDIIGDPMLAQTGSILSPEWFKLRNVSPAIGHALPLEEVTADYFLNLRDTEPDMGAAEYVTGTMSIISSSLDK